jgi:hypothetical protein
LTSTVYACCQAGQIFLWFWANCGPPRKSGNTDKHKFFDFARKDGWLHNNGFYAPMSVSWFLEPNSKKSANKPWTRLQPKNFWQVKMVWCVIYYFFAVMFGTGAIFAVLGGTLMQLMGVYSANICYVTTEWWSAPWDQRPDVIISTNTEEMIASAKRKTSPHSFCELGIPMD